MGCVSRGGILCPALASRNFGIAVAEAMALAVPVLITQKVNIWREVQLSGAGHVVSDEIDEIADGLRHMCTLSEVELQIMRLNARNCFLSRFDLEKNAIELLNLMGSLSGMNSREAKPLG